MLEHTEIDDYYYRKQIHKEFEEECIETVKSLVDRLLESRGLWLEITDAKDLPPREDGKMAGFDDYVYCKHKDKDRCPVLNNARYEGYVKGLGYVYHGDTLLQVYSNVLSGIMKSIYPAYCASDSSVKQRMRKDKLDRIKK